jgi:hypothetical protein
MSKVLSLALACASLTGCASNGARVAYGVSALSTIVAASQLHVDVFCGGTDFLGNRESSCPDNTTSLVFVGIAAAAALVGFGFEAAHAMHEDDRPAPPKPAVVTTPDEAPTLGIVDALASAKRYATERAYQIDDAQLRTRFDRTARIWMFDWRTTTDVTVIVVNESGRTTGRQCTVDEVASNACVVVP